MRNYLRFLAIGLILGLYTEALLKLVAGINPKAFGIALLAYPILLTLAAGGSRLLDALCPSRWIGDLIHFLGSGIFGLAFEWTLLGNHPGSNAIQIGMFAMWTTFCFGPRVLTRKSRSNRRARRRFWFAFFAASLLLISIVLMASSREAKVVLAVYGLTMTYSVWSVWTLVLAWRGRGPDANRDESPA